MDKPEHVRILEKPTYKLTMFLPRYLEQFESVEAAMKNGYTAFGTPKGRAILIHDKLERNDEGKILIRLDLSEEFIGEDSEGFIVGGNESGEDSYRLFSVSFAFCKRESRNI
jgi:hypothetical protein